MVVHGLQERTCFTRDSSRNTLNYQEVECHDLCKYEDSDATHHIIEEQFNTEAAANLLEVSALGNVTDWKNKGCPPKSGTCSLLDMAHSAVGKFTQRE